MKYFILLVLLIFSGIVTKTEPVKAAFSQDEQTRLIVSDDGPYNTLAEALSAAEDGTIIEIRGGTYKGPFLIDKSVVLEGIDWPVLDGNNQGTVLELTAPGIIVRGFVIRGSGDSLDEENSGIVGEAEGLVVENNRFEDTLFGVYLREANHSVIRNNTIQGKLLDVPRRGDPIRVWYSADVLISDNAIIHGRDVVLWYSERLTVENNSVEQGRYGLHFMYCDDAVITGNYLANNSVGTFMMYSRRLRLIANTIAYNHGPSGYGIGMKDMDDAVVQDNLFFGNRIGAYLDNSPREVDSLGMISNNVFAYNDMGVSLMPSVRHNVFSQNSFVENQEHVNIAGGGRPGANEWSLNGIGNYWSDYAGYDQDQDGIGDEPYKAERLFESLMDKYPGLQLLQFSPATQAIDFAAKAVPFVRPQPKLIDSAPLMRPEIPEGLPALQQKSDPLFPYVPFALLFIAFLFYAVPGIPIRSENANELPAKSLSYGESMIQVTNLKKKYGKRVVLSDVNFSIAAGEAVALWGPNGAGKTTALRCLLGVIPSEGNLMVAELDMRKDGKQGRRKIGFVPQELTLHDDLSVIETLGFYGKLKKVVVEGQTLENALEKVGLASHQQKLVGELSGGLKQRLALAIALLGDPPILFLDEPTSNLDAKGRVDFLSLLLSLKAQGKTLVFSSHRLEEITVLADRVLLLENGKLVADVPPLELANQDGWNVALYLHIAESEVSPAVHTLVQKGYFVSPNGKGLRVKVTPGKKGGPIGVLADAGISVVDFEIEHEANEWN